MNIEEAKASIVASQARGLSPQQIARKLFLVDSPAVFVSNGALQYEILDKISQKFQIPIRSIQIVGSAQIGCSLHKGTLFDAKSSDIDFAIVDLGLFHKLAQTAFLAGDGLQSPANFPIDKESGKSTQPSYRSYVARGILRPELMPNCPERADWMNFFGMLSDNYSDYCNGMSGVIYASDLYLEWRLREVVDRFLGQSERP